MYLKIKPNYSYKIIDIETDGLSPSQIWCCVVKDIESGHKDRLVGYSEIRSFFDKSGDQKIIWIGHNILGYDAPVINKLILDCIDYNLCIDTLVYSYLYNPALDNGHSLESWGIRLNSPKGDYSDWSKFTPEMLIYCEQDVDLTHKVFIALSKKMSNLGYSELSFEIEHKIKRIIEKQTENGFWFDRTRAENFRDFLKQRQSDLAKDIGKLFPSRRTKVAEYPLRRRKDGSPHSSYEKHRIKYPEVIVYEDEARYECYDLVEFNIGSPKQRIERLLELGWEPTSFTPKGSPKVDEDALVAYSESLQEGDPRKEPIKALAEWLVIQGRLTMLAGNPATGSLGWLGYVGPDSRIHGKVITCGATTRRMIHSKPNSANIPSHHKAKYGKEARSLWGVEPGKGLIEVGVDASGLENVGLLHYLNNDKATEVLNQKKPNDVHSLNARELSQALGREIDREYGSKTSYYALLFGAYPKKLGQIVKGSVKDGEIVHKTIIKNIPGFKDLIELVQNQWKENNGRIRCIDGGYVICESANAALNYLIQSLGAVVMKLACIILHEEAEKQGLEFKLMGFIHDELQMETREENGDKLGKLAVWSIEEAARRLNFRVPLSGQYILGDNWASCH